MEFFLELLSNGLLTGMLYALVALGLVFIYKASDVVNFAQFSMVLLAGFIVATLIAVFNLPVWVALLIGLGIMIGLSFGVERLVLRPLLAQPIISLIVATLGLSIFITGLHILFSNIWWVYTLDIGIPEDPIYLAGASILPVNIVGAAIAIVLFTAAAYFYMKTRTGVSLRAISDDHEASLSMGISVRRLWVIVWAIAGLAALVAGVMWGSRMGVQQALSLIAFKALAVVILGGLDSMAGAIIAGLFVGATENIVSGYLDPLIGGGTKEFFPYMLMLIALWVRPYGLFGKEIIERV